ncbi:hypothetical protein CO731_04865 [Aminobacter sp. MSH1]|uniref:hypothetical protein n=1 Tax=Aminobacter sp. MSH1 TaxID=374606 RepID=UPI000D38D527|nr:hypothetical protein [Aminobacter sp. MSH1]AWC25370.1 hypothetical protein CO731_04865 [Aminobacter sp. MSH1]
MAIKQLSDGGTSGLLVGQSSTDKIGFYGLTTPIAKQTCTLSAALTAGTTTPANIAAAVDELHAALAELGIIA